MWFIGYFLLVAVYYIPVELMDNHIKQSSTVFYKEGTYPSSEGQISSRLDNFSDALMILTATHNDSENEWKAAVNATRYGIKGKNPVEVLLSISAGEKSELHDVAYARYWHGYLIFLKPLLAICNYIQVRYLIMFIQLGLFLWLTSQLTIRNRRLIIPTYLMWIFLNPLATMNSIQFNSILVIIFVFMSLILRFINSWKDNMYMWGLMFLFIGILTSYFDLLTYPLVTLGVPLILWLALNISNHFSKNIQNILLISSFWLIGYGGMWGGKWILGSIITGSNIVVNAFDAISNRTSSVASANQQSISFYDVIEKQLQGSWQPFLFAVLLIFAFLLLYKIVRLKICNANYMLTYALVALYPFFWYFVLKNHSYVHYWFTYRELVITVYALLVFTACIGLKNNIQNR